MKRFFYTLAVLVLCAVPLVSASCPCNRSARVERVIKHLSYLSGPIIPNAQVISVLWGSKVEKGISSMIPGYVGAILQSAWIDWLCQYNTLGLPKPTTKQILKRGNLVTQKAIVPFNKKTTITDIDIQIELTKQFNAGKLPKPNYEGREILNIYLISFPSTISIKKTATSTSCKQFCAYHSHFKYKKRPVIYAVNSDCTTGCGKTPVLAAQQNISHELADSITNPFPQPASFHSAWVDKSGQFAGFEAADLCEGVPPGTVTVNGKAYPVAKLWSNSQNACIATNPKLAKGPVITGPKEVKVGQKVQLKATGRKAPFQWYHNGLLIPRAVKSTYTIANAKKSNAGTYIARGSCTAGSAPFVLKVT